MAAAAPHAAAPEKTMVGPPLPMPLEEDAMWSTADSQADSPESEWAAAVIPADAAAEVYDAAAGCAAVMSLGAHAATAVHVAEVAPVAAKGLEAASAAAGNCEPVGNPHSTRELHYVHM